MMVRHPSFSANVFEAGRVALTVAPDGAATTNDYEAAEGFLYVRTSTRGIFSDGAFSLVDGKSTRTRDFLDAQGNVAVTVAEALVGGEWLETASATNSYNVMHALLGTVRSNGRFSASSRICTGPLWTLGEDGIATTNLYDSTKRMVSSTRYGPFGAVATAYALDADGRVVAETRTADGMTPLSTSRTYDAEGRLYTRTLARHRDTFGRDTGYSLNNSRKTVVEYESATGRIRRMQNAGAWFTFYYLPGTDLKSRLQYGGSGSAYYSYEPHRDLLTQVRNYINGGVISQYDYANDAIGRRTEISRSGSMMSETRTDYYGYNDRSELVSGTKDTAATNLTEYAYQYDDIGNRLSSLDLGTNRAYTANSLNQYTNIVEGAGGFLPQFDDDGNQTLIKTATGVWQVTYNGENRPVLWECGSTNITMKFDRMGRRVEYVEMVNGVTNTHHRFVYDGYVCIQRLNGAANNSIDLVFGWDPSEPVATRPLILQKYGAYSLFYTHDGNKNVSELVFFQQANGIAAHYEYAPFGAVTMTNSNSLVTAYDFREYNTFRFSSEYADNALGLVYYNYRHYDAVYSRWTTKDPIEDLYLAVDGAIFTQLENEEHNTYALVNNMTLSRCDQRGLACGSTLTDWIVSDKPGGFDFTGPCEGHDNCYSKSGDSRKCCDDNFLKAMQEVCNRQPEIVYGWCTKKVGGRRHSRRIRYRCKKYPRKRCLMYAKIYYTAVRSFGWMSYEELEDDEEDKVE